MSVCEEGREYINNCRVNQFQDSVQVLLEAIKENFKIDVDFVNPSIGVRHQFLRSGYFLDARTQQRVIELPPQDIIELTNRRVDTLKGFYQPDWGKIILNSDLWCKKTLLHELFHALSTSSEITNLNIKYRDYFEGITEFFTGYLLSRIAPNCYNVCWRQNEKSKCYRTYYEQLRVFFGMFHFIPIQYAFQLYFGDGNRDWELKWSKFIGKIHERGYNGFDNILENDRTPKILLLKQECSKRFGREYLRILEKLRDPFNMNGILFEE